MNSPFNLLTDSILTLPKPDQLDQFAQRIHQEHQLCIQSPKTSLIHACNAGGWLLKAQTLVASPEWGKWLKTQCNLTEKTAQIYMRMAGKYPQVQSQIEPLKLPSTSKGLPASAVTSEAEYSQPIPQLIPQKITLNNPQVTSETESVIDVDFTPIQTHSPNSEVNLIRFCLSGSVVPKARPRVTSHGTYMPNRYREWRNRAEIELYRQMSQFRSDYKFPLQKAAVALRFFGNHRTNSDLDNMAGACLDALTLNGAGVLIDDRLSCLPRLTVEYVSGTDETGVWIEIQPL